LKMDEDAEIIIMDIGSGHLKAGFASSDQPKYNVPMIVGKPKAPGIMVGMD
jgi:actin-related protein